MNGFSSTIVLVIESTPLGRNHRSLPHSAAECFVHAEPRRLPTRLPRPNVRKLQAMGPEDRDKRARVRLIRGTKGRRVVQVHVRRRRPGAPSRRHWVRVTLNTREFGRSSARRYFDSNIEPCLREIEGVRSVSVACHESGLTAYLETSDAADPGQIVRQLEDVFARVDLPLGFAPPLITVEA